jgi:hypothetical protein
MKIVHRPWSIVYGKYGMAMDHGLSTIDKMN